MKMEPTPEKVAEILRKLIDAGHKVPSFSAEMRQDGMHVHVDIVVPWEEMK